MRIVGGMWKGRPLEAPEGRDVTRPTTDRTREAIASMFASACGLSFEGLRVLDAFAGSGAIGLELLSRGAARCTFVDVDRVGAARVRRNALSLGAPEGTWEVRRSDVFRLAQAGAVPGGPFDIVVLDPPYATPAADVTRLVEDLAGTGVLGEGALVLYERDGHGDGLAPRGFSLVKSKRYGRTSVDLLRRDGEEGGVSDGR